MATMDTLIGGVHFLNDDSPDLIARKALRVNLSDLAAKGAEPFGYLLSLSLPPSVDEAWISEFTSGLAADQQEFKIVLWGGDTTSTPGPLMVSVTALGTVPEGQMIRRDGAKPGDTVWVTGTIGDGSLGLDATAAGAPDAALADRYRLPHPRLDIAKALRGVATACADISDGLVADLGHIAEASGVCATIRTEDVPLSTQARNAMETNPDNLLRVLTGGDDYELVLTVTEANGALILSRADALGIRMTKIGEISGKHQAEDVYVLNEGKLLDLPLTGYSHF